MDFKLIWTDSAIEDLGGIVRFISVFPEKQDSRWRKLIVKSWKIAYQIDSNAKAVHVIRIWHAAQDEIDFGSDPITRPSE